MQLPIQSRIKKLNEELKNSVRDFYVSDEISKVMPEQKDYVSLKILDKKVRVQKRLVLNNLKELYKNYQEQNPTTKIGFSSFALLCPKECVLP